MPVLPLCLPPSFDHSLPGLGAPCPWKQLGKPSVILPLCVFFGSLPSLVSECFFAHLNVITPARFNAVPLGVWVEGKLRSPPSSACCGLHLALSPFIFIFPVNFSSLIYRDAVSTHRSTHHLSCSSNSVADFIKDPKRALPLTGFLIGYSLTYYHRCTFPRRIE